MFFHIVGALGFFLALGLEWTGLWQLRSALLSQEVRAWMGLLKSARRGGFASMLAIVISGVYLMATAWGRLGLASALPMPRRERAYEGSAD